MSGRSEPGPGPGPGAGAGAARPRSGTQGVERGELAEAVEELAKELERFQQNMQKVIEYQASLLRVNKLMCFWMENTQELVKHRRQTSQPSVSTLKLLRK